MPSLSTLSTALGAINLLGCLHQQVDSVRRMTLNISLTSVTKLKLVVLDWVPAHFPSDDHGLANFDGTPLFHDPDPRRGWHQVEFLHIRFKP